MNLDLVLGYCLTLESIAPDYGMHIGLTGGCLYKVGERKDADIILYRIRQGESDLGGFFTKLVELGWTNFRPHGWVMKARSPSGDEFDFFYPEHIDQTGEGGY